MVNEQEARLNRCRKMCVREICALMDEVDDLHKELCEIGFAAQVALNNFEKTELVKSTLKMISNNWCIKAQ